LHYEGSSAQVSNILDGLRSAPAHPWFFTGHVLLHAGVFQLRSAKSSQVLLVLLVTKHRDRAKNKKREKLGYKDCTQFCAHSPLSHTSIGFLGEYCFPHAI